MILDESQLGRHLNPLGLGFPDPGERFRHKRTEICCPGKLLKVRRGEPEFSAHYRAQHR